MFVLLLAAAVARPPVPALTPTFRWVQVTNGVIGWTEPRFRTDQTTVTKTRTVERNGRQMTEAYTVTEPVEVAYTYEVKLDKEARFETPAGKPLTYAQAAEGLLRRPVAVLYTGPGEPVRSYLKLLKDDAVVIHYLPAPDPNGPVRP